MPSAKHSTTLRLNEVKSKILSSLKELPEHLLTFLYPELLPLLAHPWTLSDEALDQAVGRYFKEVAKQAVALTDADLRILVSLVDTLPIGWLCGDHAAPEKRNKKGTRRKT